MRKTFNLLLVLVSFLSRVLGQDEQTSPDNNNSNSDTIIVHISDKGMKDASGLLAIDFEQDYFIDWLPRTNFDRNYTQGTAFSYNKYGQDESVLYFPIKLLEKLVYGPSLPDHITVLPATVSIGVTAFTPLDIADSLNPVIGDRPFSNVVFFTTAKTVFNTNTKFLITTSFNYGFIGSNVGNAFQSFAHYKLIPGRPTNIGWQYQISNGGHPAFLFSHSATRSMFEVKDKEKKHTLFQGFLGYRLNLGWYTGIAASTSFRVGRFSQYSTYQSFHNALASASLDPESKNVRVVTDIFPKWRTDWYFFGTLSPRMTPYNSFLLGQPGIKSVYTLPKENFNPFILDSEFGLFVSLMQTVDDVIIPLKRYDLLLSINARTSEIISKDSSQPNKYSRTHSWGRVTIRFPLF